MQIFWNFLTKFTAKFEDLKKVDHTILSAIKESFRFKKMTPVQSLTIKDSLGGSDW